MTAPGTTRLEGAGSPFTLRLVEPLPVRDCEAPGCRYRPGPLAVCTCADLLVLAGM